MQFAAPFFYIDLVLVMEHKKKIRAILILLTAYLLMGGQAKGQEVYLEKKVEQDSFVMYLLNESYMPLYVQVMVNENIPADSRALSDFILPAKSESEKVIIIPILNDTDTTWLQKQNFADIRLQHGNPFEVKADNTYPYGIPFQRKKAYRLIQGFNGEYSHQEPASRFALDFAMPIGEKICAAREGIVVKVKVDSREGGPAPKYKGKDNHVVILHDDGTLAYYVHLDYEGALVKEGEQVRKGQELGFSGHTGYSTRPHLHFVIRQPTPEGPIAIPFRFAEYPEMDLKVGRKLRRRR